VQASDQQLLTKHSGDLEYELWMLRQTALRLRDDSALHCDRVVKNAVIEAFTTHARALTEFLFPEREKRRRDTDIIAQDCVVDPARWITARGAIPTILGEVITRSGKEIAHLTTERRASGDPSKEWPLLDIVEALRTPLETFAAHAAPSRLHPDVSVAIRELQLPMTTPQPVVVYNSTSTGILTSPRPGPFFTDVQTRPS
jgi:hypothetical protein